MCVSNLDFVASGLDKACDTTSCFFSSVFGPKSKWPSFMLTMFRVENSLRKVEMYFSKPPATTLSGACDGGVRDGLVVGQEGQEDLEHRERRNEIVVDYVRPVWRRNVGDGAKRITGRR